MPGPIDKKMKLGELLRALGVVEAAELQETIKLAVVVGLPLGRALVLAGHLTEDELEAALEIQLLVQKGTLTIATATEAFGYVRDGMSLTAALERSGCEKAVGVHIRPSRLGSLFFDAKLLTKKELDEAQRASYENGMPLGRTLCMVGFITQAQLTRALELQRLVRVKRISHNQAVLDLQGAKPPQPDPQPSLSSAEKATPHKTIKLGELLLLAGVLTENDIMNALEHGLTSTKSLGDVLVEMGVLTLPILEHALELQESISSGALNIHAGIDTLSYFASLRNAGIDYMPPMPETAEAISQTQGIRSETIKFGELLRISGFIEDSDIKQALELSQKHPTLIGKMLLVSGAIDEGALLAALRCQFLLRNGHISQEEAVRALKFARTWHLTLEDALEEMNIPVPLPRAPDWDPVQE